LFFFRNEIFIAPSAVQKERIQVGGVLELENPREYNDKIVAEMGVRFSSHQMCVN